MSAILGQVTRPLVSGPPAGSWWTADPDPVPTDEGAGRQCGAQREAGLRVAAGLDPERHAERQHCVRSGVPGGEVRVAHRPPLRTGVKPVSVHT